MLAQSGASTLTATLPSMDKPAPDPPKLLGSWMECERVDTNQSHALENLDNGGLRDVLEEMQSPESP